MELLSPEHYPKVMPLIEASGMKGCRAKWYSVLEGIQPGDVYVDDAAHPRTALIRGYRVAQYLFGDAGVEAFRRFLPELAAGKIPPAGGSLFATSESVRAALNRLLQPEHHRLAYRYDPPDASWPPPNWRERIPPGFSFDRMDERLTRQVVDLIAPWDWFASRWGGVDGFLRDGFGFCTRSENGDIANFCVTSMVGGGEAEIQIVSGESYQRRGLGTLAVFAYTEYCLANGLVPGWTTDPENIRSQSMAPKLGFVLEGPIYYWQSP